MMISRPALIVAWAIAFVVASSLNASADREHPGAFLAAGSKAGCFDSISNIKLMIKRGLEGLDNTDFERRHAVHPAGGTPFMGLRLGTFAQDGDEMLVRITAGPYAGTTCWALTGGVELN